MVGKQQTINFFSIQFSTKKINLVNSQDISEKQVKTI